MYFELERTGVILNDLKENICRDRHTVSGVFFGEGKQKPQTWRSFAPGELWGGYDHWCWFWFDITVPHGYEGAPFAFGLRTGREHQWDALNPQFILYVNGELIQGMDTNHTDVILTREPYEGQVFHIELAAYSGTANPAEPYECNPDRQYPKRLEFQPFFYRHSINDEKLYYHLKAPYEAALRYSKEDERRIAIEKHLTAAINLIDTRIQRSAQYDQSVLDAIAYMETEFYEKQGKETEITANCVGHTHIDVAWLWTLEQTQQKAVRSFSTVLNLMKEYPEYIFMSSQPQLYAYVKKNAPQVYEQIKKRVAEGRWEPEGAMWLEADCNLSSGESLVRQIIHGKRFFKEEFDHDCRILWLPDVFGYSAALPQILKKSGIEYFVTSKISWNEYNRFPYDTFNWKGIDGTRIFTQFINASETGGGDDDHRDFFSTYNAKIDPNAIAGGWRNYQQKKINQETLVSFGYGDGGGGPTREMLEMAKRMEKGIPGCPKVKITKAYDALQRIEKNAVSSGKLPQWAGELYLEYHRGTYTSMARNKRYNRKAEFLMQSLEALCLTGSMLEGQQYPAQDLYNMWETILLNQFHDIIPGSSIEDVYIDSQAQYEELFSKGNALLQAAVSRLAEHTQKEGILVYNPTGIRRSGLAQYGGKQYFIPEIEPFGWTVIEDKTPEASGELSVGQNRIETPYYIMELNGQAEIIRLYDKENNREVIADGERANVLQAFEDKPFHYDAWDINIYYQEKMWEITDVQQVQTEQDALSVTVTVKRNFLNSTIVQKIVLYQNSRRIDFKTDIDWKEEHILLKTAFPVDIVADKAVYEIQYGNVERPNHNNTSWDIAKFEVCAHKWADLSENGYGVSLLNDCKYGYDVKDNIMRLTLLKSATSPNPNADREKHTFCYALLPHQGSFREGGTIREAYDLNSPLICAPAKGGGRLPDSFSMVQCSAENVVVEVLKQSYDEKGMVVRIYECFGKRTAAQMVFGFKARQVWEADLLEQKGDRMSCDSCKTDFVMKPYEIKTFYIER